MNILVCVSNVPDTTSKISFVEGNTKFNTEGVTFICGPYDDYALARAVEIKEQVESQITVLNVGLADTEAMLRKCLAIGADKAVRINVEPQDSYQVAIEIANYAKDKAFDMILMGRETIDFNGGLVHNMVGEILQIPTINPIMELLVAGNVATVKKEIEGGKQKLEVTLPAVFGCQEPIAEWKIPNMRGIMTARTKPLEIIESSANLLTKVAQFELPPVKGACKMIPAEEAENLIDLLKFEAKIL